MTISWQQARRMSTDETVALLAAATASHRRSSILSPTSPPSSSSPPQPPPVPSSLSLTAAAYNTITTSTSTSSSSTSMWRDVMMLCQRALERRQLSQLSLPHDPELKKKTENEKPLRSSDIIISSSNRQQPSLHQHHQQQHQLQRGNQRQNNKHTEISRSARTRLVGWQQRHPSGLWGIYHSDIHRFSIVRSLVSGPNLTWSHLWKSRSAKQNWNQ